MVGSASKGDKVVSIDDWPKGAQYAWLGAPNDSMFFDAIGDKHWRKEKPWIRQFLVEIVGAGKGYIVLKSPLPFAFPAGTEIRAAQIVSGVELTGFTLVQYVPGLSLNQAHGKYENLAPQYAVDGLRFDWAAKSSVKAVKILGAGRHPLVFENSRAIRASDMEIEGAWNKGKGGNGYIRFARSYDCELVQSKVENIRHLVFQWGAIGNRVRNSILYTDVNFHGGYSQDNIVENSEIRPPKGHLWGKITRMPAGGDSWAPPDGEANKVQMGE